MLNDRLKEARLKARLTQKEIADAVGIATTTYNGYERGKSDPDINTLCKMMNVLNVDANFIYQDYNVNKESPASNDAGEGNISLETSTRALVAMGLIRDGEQLSDDDLAFIGHIMGLLNAWFAEKDKQRR